MSLLKLLWGLLFRLFPTPTPLGLRKVGTPDRGSPVLVTCNFDLTVRRLLRALRGTDAWVLVAQSRGVNVWCAAGGREFDTDAVVSAVKTSRIADHVEHRTLLLPPLGAPGIRAVDVEQRTGWTVRWGPVRMTDLPRFLAAGGESRDEPMKRATWRLGERLDTALGSLFGFLLLGGIGFAVFGPGLLLDYVLVSALTFVGFWAIVPWVPGRLGLQRALLIDLVLAAALVACELLLEIPAPRPRADLITAMALVLVFGAEVGGMASTLGSELDPLIARLGIRKMGNVAFAGTVRTDLLNGWRTLTHSPERCTACTHCHEVCPLGVWEPGDGGRAVLAHPAACTACTACLTQCPSGAIQARRAG